MAESNAVGGLIRTTSKESIISAISHVGNWEIGDRCQIGERMGNIVYIGPARFAPGEWIGIVLDQPLGKNDGSVDGHRYFSCEPNYGLFCKASKLERVQSPNVSTEKSQNNPFCKEYGLEIGDRVIVSGGKYGRLRFLGNTDFKEGVWAGVELDQPVGKNDGSVQGKRYFTCKAPYGLFAAASKVIRAPEQISPKFKVRHTKTSALRQRRGSHESLSSIGASSVASSRISKYNFATPQSVKRPFIISSSRGQEDLFKAIKESLKEKETHLEQMIRERDLERNEMAALSNRCELAEAKAAQLENAKTSVDQQLETLRVMLNESETKLKAADGTINNLTVVLKETKDALEDLTFRYDEEIILKAELAEKIAELEKKAVVKESEDDRTKTLMDEMEKAKLEMEELKKQCSAFEQERLSICAGIKNILSIYKQDFTELIQLVSINDTVEIINDDGTATTSSNRDLWEQLKSDVEKLNTLMKHSKRIKKLVQEKIESNAAEKKDLVDQLDILKKSMNDKVVSSSQKDVKLTFCQTNMDQLRNELEQVKSDKAKLQEKYNALEMLNNTLMEKYDQSNKKNAEMAGKIEDERKEHTMEVTRLNEESRKAQNDAIQLEKHLKKIENEKTELLESREFLENNNRKLLEDIKLLEPQKIALENELRQIKSEKEILSSSLAQKEVELGSTKSKINDLTGQIDRLHANLCEAGISGKSLKKELESLHERNKKETAEHILQVTELQTVNESLEKDLLATKNSFQILEKEHNAMKNTLEKTQSEVEKFKGKLLSSQQELIAEQQKVVKLQHEIVSHASTMEQLRRFQEEAATHAETQSKLQSENDAAQQMLHNLEAEKEIFLKEKAELLIEHAKIKERYEALMQSSKDRVSIDTYCNEKMQKIGTQRESTSGCKEGFSEKKISNLLEEEIQQIGTEERLKLEIQKLMAEKTKQGCALTSITTKLSEFEQERELLAASLNKKESEQNVKDAELNLLKTEIINIKDESKRKDGIIKSLETEILELSKKQAENEGTVSEAKHRSTLFADLEEEWKNKEIAYIQEIQELKSTIGKTETDKIEEMKRDISFLNSIIAEQYKKEENLKEQIAILNSLPANEIIAELQRKTSHDVTLRVYCDICEVFDLHDTTDCPTQAMDVDDEVIPKKNKRVKPPARPYCEECEEFGHDKSNCSKLRIEKPRSKDYTF